VPAGLPGDADALVHGLDHLLAAAATFGLASLGPLPPYRCARGIPMSAMAVTVGQLPRNAAVSRLPRLFIKWLAGAITPVAAHRPPGAG
jgi:hypothetical protein